MFWIFWNIQLKALTNELWPSSKGEIPPSGQKAVYCAWGSGWLVIFSSWLTDLWTSYLYSQPPQLYELTSFNKSSLVKLLFIFIPISLYIYTYLHIYFYVDNWSACLDEPWLMQNLVLEVVLEEQNIKDNFSELILGFLELVF